MRRVLKTEPTSSYVLILFLRTPYRPPTLAFATNPSRLYSVLLYRALPCGFVHTSKINLRRAAAARMAAAASATRAVGLP